MSGREGGRGSGALLGAELRVSASRGGGRLPLAYMQPGPFQPRRVIETEALAELAASIKASGMIQPIVVRPRPALTPGEAKYEIVAGERRWRAAQLAGLQDIPVVVRDLSDGEAAAVALIENIQREELTPADEARALARLTAELRLTHEELGRLVGRSRAAVTNLIRLLELPEEILRLVDERRLSMGHARAILGVADPAAQLTLGRSIAERGSSVREAEDLVRRALQDAGAAGTAARRVRPVVSEVLKARGVRVELRQKPDGAARIVVEVEDAGRRDAVIAAIRAGLGGE